MTPAEELRTAAAQLRDRATEAVHEDRHTWATGNTLGSKSPVVVDDPEKPSVLIETYAARLEAVNRYLALLGPATGLAFAAWLDAAARGWDSLARVADLPELLPKDKAALLNEGPYDGAQALAVARAILGSQP